MKEGTDTSKIKIKYSVRRCAGASLRDPMFAEELANGAAAQELSTPRSIIIRLLSLLHSQNMLLSGRSSQ